MKLLHLVSIATCIALCNASYIFITKLSDLTTGVGYKVEFLCRLNTSQQDDNLHKYIVWSVDGVIVKSESTKGMYTINSVPVSMNNSVIQCSFFSSLISSARLNLIGQPDTPILNIVTTTHSSVAMNIDVGNTKGSPISEIRITLPNRIWNYRLNPPKWTSFDYNINYLQSDTNYVVRVRCWNGYKWSQLGTAQGTTLPNRIVSQTKTLSYTIATEIPSNANQSFASFNIILFLLLILF